MFGNEKNGIVRVKFLRDTAGPTLVAQSGDVLELPTNTARGLIRAGIVEETTAAVVVMQPDVGPYGARARDLRNEYRKWGEQRQEMQLPS